MKKLLTVMGCALSVATLTHARPSFDKSKDILIAQFDSKPDPDDIHAQAALGCMLAHSSFEGVNYFAVAGAYGTQNNTYIESGSLFTLAFGYENEKWTDAHNDWNSSVTRIKDKVKPILTGGGKVWVQEAGQSNITADWISALINEGVDEDVVKDNVIVVQHSDWNEDNTAASDLDYVKDKATYYAIDDGNAPYGSTTWGDRGPYSTPAYNTDDTSYMGIAKSSQNEIAKALWTEADYICDNQGYHPDWSNITVGGVDYSDCAENWWIFEVEDAASVSEFWNKFVTNDVDDTTTPVEPPSDSTVELNAVNDAYLQGSNSYNTNILRVEAGNRVSYLQFDLDSIDVDTIESMELQLTVDGDSGNGTVEISQGSSTSWSETNLTTSNAPEAGDLLDEVTGNLPIGETVSFDVSEASIDSNGTTVTLVVSMVSGGNDVSFASAEASSNGPKLVVTTKE